MALAIVLLSCTADIGSAEKENVPDPLGESKNVVVMPPTARTPFHAQALSIGSNMVSNLTLDLKDFGLSEGDTVVVAEAARTNMVAAVQSLVIGGINFFMSLFASPDEPTEPIIVVVEPINKGAVGAVGGISANVSSNLATKLIQSKADIAGRIVSKRHQLSREGGRGGRGAGYGC